MKPRDNETELGLVPDNNEILRRIREELDFVRRLVEDVLENPESYSLAEDLSDIHLMSKELLRDIAEMSTRLNVNDVNAEAFKKERLSGPSGEAKTNVWRRLRERVERLVFGGSEQSAKLAAIAEYTDFGITVMNSVYEVLAESPTGKAIAEGLGLMKQAFSAAARRVSIEEQTAG